MTIRFADEAGETFRTFVDWMGERRYTVELVTLDGEQHTATLHGSDPESEWYDAVLVQAFDAETGTGIGAVFGCRVASLLVC